MLRFLPIDKKPWTVLEDIERACYPPDDCWNHYTLRMVPILHSELSELALDDDRAVASSIVARCDGNRDAWVLGLSVVPAERGSGVGSRLLDRAIERCDQTDIARLLLTVSPSNQLATEMYRRRGFTEVDRDEQFYGPGRGRLVLARKL